MAAILRTAKRIDKVTAELARLRQQLREEIVAAQQAGDSISEIARQLGVSRARVQQLLREQRQ
jgi:DNA-directed RNA polymerase specialized sigma24 family protein